MLTMGFLDCGHGTVQDMQQRNCHFYGLARCFVQLCSTSLSAFRPGSRAFADYTPAPVKLSQDLDRHVCSALMERTNE